MATFKDNADREWEINIDAPTVMRVREECDPKFLLGDDERENTYARLEADPVLLCRVIYLLCDDQRQELGISEKDFYLGVIGDAIENATSALLVAILDFTPTSKRELLRAAVDRMGKLRTVGTARALKKINDPKLEEKVLTVLDREIDATIDNFLDSHSAVKD